MKSLFTALITLLVQNLIQAQPLSVQACQPFPKTVAFSKATLLQNALDSLVASGVPGATLAVLSAEGFWETAAGYASLEQKQRMQTCHLQYLQSVAKTYMAVAILQLYERGRLQLDAPITNYLPAAQSDGIPQAGKITVRMLLNHTAGMRDYNFSPAYVSKLLQHPEHRFRPEEYLQYIRGKKADFAPGERYAYRNSHYLLLALIADAVTGNHASFIHDNIFVPLQLNHSFYRSQPGYLQYPDLSNGYWDRNGNGTIENASILQRGNVMDMVGDDGIVATPRDAVYFLHGLSTGKLLHDSTFAIMKTWVQDSKGNNRYGLGLTYRNEDGYTGFGHSGGGIGAGCELYYFPEQDIYAFLSINLGTVTDSPIHEIAGKFRKALYKSLLGESAKGQGGL